MTSSLPLPSNPPLTPLNHRPRTRLPFTLNLTPTPKFHISATSSSSNWEREEARWLREEQRWLREEQRWLREESRWTTERQSLLREISELKFRVQQLEHQSSVSASIPDIAALLQLRKDSAEVARIAESGSSALPMVLESKEVKEEKVGDKKKRKTLRVGSEGEEVRAMQEALQNLGFYSGEEDVEFSSFSSGTERAVKTWQASLGAPENGIMTAELLERLFMEQHIEAAGLKRNIDPKENDASPPKEGVNGAPVASVTEISEIQQKVLKEEGFTEVEVSQQRVFLLGENRWEEPSRLVGRDKKGGGNKPKDATTKCLTCRGEGRLMCTECDGTGEPNIEPQFLDWVDEGVKCPYCEGLGHTICDVCEGKTTI
ncbi:protein disulfide isomerase pTAC5, chloroplastic isoform X2 [Vitis riparia]|uniref:protein disulfide isomerase pTAC5, chloroplastic isoform X2 n=1 Tax=Vitis riparia TaxID=96939 RepID=UPI00155A4C80|nr:protein disulfide isomerase pTAC5, chloroplastic isoform X2 [Vitis riparia]